VSAELSDVPSDQRGDALPEADVKASGLMSEALERVERARGALYDLHQLIGGADNQLDEVIEALREAGRDDLASSVASDLVGIDVLPGMWTFQVVEAFDDGFYATWKRFEERIRSECTNGERHVLEARMKADRQS
jgi:hypothetical protein